MFREFVIVLCAGALVHGIAVQQNAPAQSSAHTSAAGQQQEYLALPSQNAYQNIAIPSSKYLPKPAPSYQVNPAVVETISEGAPAKSVPVQSYGSPNVQQQTVQVSASVAADPSSPEYNNILERYVPVVRPIQPYFSASLPAKTVSIASHGAASDQIQARSVQTHPPPAPKYAPAPIPVPVIYQQVGAYPLPSQQFAVVTNAVAPTADMYLQAPVGAQVIPVPVYTNGARLQYQHIPVTGGQQYGYAKAVSFSPASEVSRVIFNGLGVSYGW